MLALHMRNFVQKMNKGEHMQNLVYLMPLLILLESIISCIVCLYSGWYKPALYWFGGAIVTTAVILMGKGN